MDKIMTYRAKESGSEAGICDRDQLWRIFSRNKCDFSIVLLETHDKIDLLASAFEKIKEN